MGKLDCMIYIQLDVTVLIVVSNDVVEAQTKTKIKKMKKKWHLKVDKIVNKSTWDKKSLERKTKK